MAANPRYLRDQASQRERDALDIVYDRLLAVDSDLCDYVRYALFVEIIEEFDYRSWPQHFILSDIIWDFQELVSNHYEYDAVDCFQRRNYMRMAMAGKNRHDDVSYGLSERLAWADKQNVIRKLISMGKRECDGVIPSSHELENDVLHVAVSYRHTFKFNQGGTICAEQAEAIWTAVRAMPTVRADAEVRVWVDQNLHRKKLPEGTEWHEFGLLPYACLSVVLVGTGDCSLKHAYTRPWLWVEMLTALRSDGIHTVPGRDIIADCGEVLTALEQYEVRKDMITQSGWLSGGRRNSDSVMEAVARDISLWRSRGFLGHEGYEYCEYFEKFVNWARMFVIRGVPYSKMAWNHPSDRAVRGMDAIALVRALPNENGRLVDCLQALVRPIISWRSYGEQDKWLVGDIVDRSEIDDIPLHVVAELQHKKDGDSTDVWIFNRDITWLKIRFRKRNGTVSMVYTESDFDDRLRYTRYALLHQQLVADLRSCSAQVVSISSREEDGPIISYLPFTLRFRVARSRKKLAVATGNACLRPFRVASSIEQHWNLNKVGVFFVKGITEIVYELIVSGRVYRLSTSEIYVLLHAAEKKHERFVQLVEVLKGSCEYKNLIYRDLSDTQKLQLTRGWRLCTGQDSLTSQGQVSIPYQNTMCGEGVIDLEIEMCERMKLRKAGSSLLWIDKLSEEQTYIHAQKGCNRIVWNMGPSLAVCEVAILKNIDSLHLLGDKEGKGLIQTIMHMKPLSKLKLLSGEKEQCLEEQPIPKIVQGLFIKCSICSRIACLLNGLTAELTLQNGVYEVRWMRVHDCVGHENLELTF